MTPSAKGTLDFIQSRAWEARSRNDVLSYRDFLNDGVIRVDLPTLNHADYINTTSLAAVLNLVNQVWLLAWQAERWVTSTGRRPSSWARSVSHWVTLPSLTDLGKMSIYSRPRSSIISCDKRGRPGITEPLRSQNITTLTTKASLSPTSWSRRKSSSSAGRRWFHYNGAGRKQRWQWEFACLQAFF